MKQYSKFEVAITKIPEVIDCAMISGEYDYMLKFIVRDMEHYDEVMRTMMEMDIGIKNHASIVVVKNVKSSLEMPLRELVRNEI
jgi:DNA-binding Lrp family transcriptional regulator